MLSSLLSLIIATNISPADNFFAETSYAINTIESSKTPVKNEYMISPVINSKSALVIDMDSGAVLYEENSNERLSVASITKIMTNYIVLQENNLDDIVTVSKKAASEQGSSMGIYAGEEISVRNLIYGSLINSGNDASTALAEYNAGSVSAFVDKMNQKVNDIGLYNTHYENPTGIDQPNHYSSAQDLAKIALKLYKNDFIKIVIQTKELTVYNENGKIKHNLKTTNDLLNNSYFKIKGFKTGTTEMAGECLMAVAELENGKEILTIVLGSGDRFRDSKILIDWTQRAYTWK